MNTRPPGTIHCERITPLGTDGAIISPVNPAKAARINIRGIRKVVYVSGTRLNPSSRTTKLVGATTRQRRSTGGVGQVVPGRASRAGGRAGSPCTEDGGAGYSP